MTTTDTPFTLVAIRDLLAAHPADLWIANRRDGDGGTHCAIGWLDHDLGYCTGGHDVLFSLFRPLVTDRTSYGTPAWAFADVNNGDDPRYQQAGPKARTMAALDDLIAGTVPPLPAKAASLS